MRLAMLAISVALVSSCVGSRVPARGLVRVFDRATGCSASDTTTTPLLDRVIRVRGCGTYVDYALQFAAWAPGYPSSRRMRTGSGRSRWLPITDVHVVAPGELSCVGDALRFVMVDETLYDVTGCGRGAAFELVCESLRCGWVHGDIVAARR